MSFNKQCSQHAFTQRSTVGNLTYAAVTPKHTNGHLQEVLDLKYHVDGLLLDGLSLTILLMVYCLMVYH